MYFVFSSPIIQVGRIIVNHDLRVANHPHIMAIGDVTVGVRDVIYYIL